ncbi:Uncharacterized protein TCM_038455 [Theobroma cacao]|uniref:Uncharacterized protein n=1 Tax=Theobroma cacao TaxID=3641 RepID=A0A061GQ51_THECC|nr:Uncharacterized protein TCM_038455 [Theobroma cacao]
MASKRFFYSIIFQCFLYAIIFLLIYRPQTSPNETNTSQHVSTESDGLSWDQLHSNFKPRPDSHKVVIQVDKITKALRLTGFKLMALILDRNLPSLIPHGDSHSDFGIRKSGTYKKNNNTITLYRGRKITIFAPPDEVISFKKWERTHYRYQIVATKVDSGDFSNCLMLPSFDPQWPMLMANYADEIPTINHVRITNWNIYNDGNVIVHGVEKNFDPWVAEDMAFITCSYVVHKLFCAENFDVGLSFAQ